MSEENMGVPRGVVVLLSGCGSNFTALLAAQVPISLVISDCSAAAGLAKARFAKLPVATLEVAAFRNQTEQEYALATLLDTYAPRLVVLAGYMRILGKSFCARFAKRLVNIHPALLPSFPGLNTHQRALDAGCQEHGCTVHWVTDKVDAGPVIRQVRVPVLPNDDVQSLAARVAEQEHVLYPAVVNAIYANEIIAP